MRGEKRKVISQWLIPTIVLIAVIGGMLYNFTEKSAEMAAAAVEEDMIVLASRYAADLKKDLKVMSDSAVPVSLAISQKYISGSQINNHSDSLIPAYDQADIDLLSKLCDHSPAYLVVYCNKLGKGITQSGEQVDLSGEEYFTSLLESAEDTYLYVEDDSVTGAGAVVHAVSIPDSTGQASFLMLLTYYPIDALGKSIRGDDLDGDFLYLLADSKGNILSHNEYSGNFLAENNISSTLTNHGYGDDIRKMNVRLKNGVSGSIKAVLGGEGRSLVYTPLSMNDWTVMIGVNQSYVDREEKKEWEYTRGTLFQLVIIICAFLLLVVLINLFNKLRNTENTKKLEEKADTDLLTGLNNKLATERKIKEYLESHPNEQSMLFVLDIDNFKKINDTMGHAFGDEVLRSLGSQITAMFRVSDIVGRVGGDEFIILLKDMKDESLLKKEGEKVARFFHDFQVGEYVKYSATASIGVAVFPKDGKDFETMYKAADQALYSAKKRGKNQLAFYHDYMDPVVIER